MPFEGEGLTAESRKAHFPVQRRLREVRVDAADNKDPVGRTRTIGNAERSLKRRIKFGVQATLHHLQSGSTEQRSDASPQGGRIRSPHSELPSASIKTPGRLRRIYRPGRPIPLEIPTQERSKGQRRTRHRRC